MKRPIPFPQGTQRIARITEVSEPNLYVLEPTPAVAVAVAEPAVAEPATTESAVAMHTPLTDAELASAFVDGEAPVVLRRAKRVTSAYTAEARDERPNLTIV